MSLTKQIPRPTHNRRRNITTVIANLASCRVTTNHRSET